MTADTFIELLSSPDPLTSAQTENLRSIISEFPYFQSAQALYLKGLKQQESFAYNKELKKTAALTTDRSVLFEYITSKQFKQHSTSDQIKRQDSRILDIEVTDEIDINLQLDQEEQEKAAKILDPHLFIEKEDSQMTPKTPEETLSIGTPLTFDQKEGHSFNEWLKLSTFQPIDRSESALANQLDKPKLEATHKTLSETKVEEVETDAMNTLSRKQKQEIIDSFINNNPKIDIKATSKIESRPSTKTSLFASESLMTETLARVYLEQKNYKKAKQAYRILSLKYPEKSSFFADQIRAVEQLEEQKE